MIWKKNHSVYLNVFNVQIHFFLDIKETDLIMKYKIYMLWRIAEIGIYDIRGGNVMRYKSVIKRYLIFLLGLFINSFGVSFVTKASLGTSPISSIPYTLSLAYPPTLGVFTLYMSLVLIVLQIIIMRKKFPKEYLLQIPVSFLFSWFIDLTMNWLSGVTPVSYPAKLLSLLFGCAILGVGVYLEMIADVVMLPGESFVNAVSKTYHTDFGRTKVVFDSVMAVGAAVIGIIVLHRLAGVREGTVIAAILVGSIARFLKQKLNFFSFSVQEAVEVPKEDMI